MKQLKNVDIESVVGGFGGDWPSEAERQHEVERQFEELMRFLDEQNKRIQY